MPPPRRFKEGLLMASRSLRLWLSLALAGVLVYCTFSAGAPPSASTHPRYTRDGRLEAPTGYRSWVFVGSNLSPEYKQDLPKSTGNQIKRQGDDKADRQSEQFHNIYINRESYESFLEKGEFLDPTVLVMEVFRAERKDPKGILTGGQVEAERVGLAVAVKDTCRPKGGVPWAYYTFDVSGHPKPVKPASAHADKDCYACHLQHASKDNVWVQFYPALRDPE
jgi:hypothetical protein